MFADALCAALIGSQFLAREPMPHPGKESTRADEKGQAAEGGPGLLLESNFRFRPRATVCRAAPCDEIAGEFFSARANALRASRACGKKLA